MPWPAKQKTNMLRVSALAKFYGLKYRSCNKRKNKNRRKLLLLYTCVGVDSIQEKKKATGLLIGAKGLLIEAIGLLIEAIGLLIE